MRADLITICPGCRRVLNFSRIGFKQRPLEGDVTDVGVECPFCQYWQHSYYLNSDLIARQKAMGDKPARKVYRPYVNDFKRFNKKMRKHFGLPSKGHKA